MLLQEHMSCSSCNEFFLAIFDWIREPACSARAHYKGVVRNANASPFLQISKNILHFWKILPDGLDFTLHLQSAPIDYNVLGLGGSHVSFHRHRRNIRSDPPQQNVKSQISFRLAVFVYQLFFLPIIWTIQKMNFYGGQGHRILCTNFLLFVICSNAPKHLCVLQRRRWLKISCFQISIHLAIESTLFCVLRMPSKAPWERWGKGSMAIADTMSSIFVWHLHRISSNAKMENIKFKIKLPNRLIISNKTNILPLHRLKQTA